MNGLGGGGGREIVNRNEEYSGWLGSPVSDIFRRQDKEEPNVPAHQQEHLKPQLSSDRVSEIDGSIKEVCQSHITHHTTLDTLKLTCPPTWRGTGAAT